MWTFTDSQMADAVKEITQAEQPELNDEEFARIYARNLEILRRYGRGSWSIE